MRGGLFVKNGRLFERGGHRGPPIHSFSNTKENESRNSKRTTRDFVGKTKSYIARARQLRRRTKNCVRRERNSRRK